MADQRNMSGITPADIIRVMQASGVYTLRSVERGLCVLALERAGTIIEAAKSLGINRHTLARRMKKHGIEWPPPKL